MNRWEYFALGLAVLGAWAWQRTQSTMPPALPGDFVGPLPIPSDKILNGRVLPGPWQGDWDRSLPINDPLRIDSKGNSVTQQPGSPLGLTITAGALY